MDTKRRNPSSRNILKKIFSKLGILVEGGGDKCNLRILITMSSNRMAIAVWIIFVIKCCHGVRHADAFFVHNNAGVKLVRGTTETVFKNKLNTKNIRFVQHQTMIQNWDVRRIKNQRIGGGSLLLHSPQHNHMNINANDEEDWHLNTASSANTKIATSEKIDYDQVSSRRRALQHMASTAALISITSPSAANAAVAEIDSKSGELYSPRKEMLGGGGSDLARGIKLESRQSLTNDRNNLRDSKEPIQTVYETRFITYLSRFLLNYDPAAASWWAEQDLEIRNSFSNSNSENGSADGKNRMSIDSQRKLRFAEFAESVEVGLANYFVGPYGSYASVKAGKDSNE